MDILTTRNANFRVASQAGLAYRTFGKSALHEKPPPGSPLSLRDCTAVFGKRKDIDRDDRCISFIAYVIRTPIP